MSQSILVTGIYRNNKTIGVGLHNPKNNRIANKKEFKHLFDMYTKHLYPISQKFKRIDISVWLHNGSKISCQRLDEAIALIKDDKLLIN